MIKYIEYDMKFYSNVSNTLKLLENLDEKFGGNLRSLSISSIDFSIFWWNTYSITKCRDKYLLYQKNDFMIRLPPIVVFIQFNTMFTFGF